jgi:ribosomal protein S18 acetylase RimI-like enzyme
VNATLHRLGAGEAAELAREVEGGYADDMELRGGIPREAARRKAAADCAKLLTDETAAAFRIDVGDERVGHLWVGEQEGPAGRMLWIYDVFVDEACRGRGLGREAMLLAEEEARRRGLAMVGLNVFGGNEVARSLYRSLGYGEVAVMMRKDVG